MSTIRIAGHNYECVLGTPDPELEAENRGRINYEDLRITIDSTLRDFEQRKTLLHELIHAADKHFGTDQMEEEQTVALEKGLWAIFNDNPGLARGIFGDNA